MTVLSIVALTVAVWGQRLLGGFVVGPMLVKRPAFVRAANLIPAAVVMAVIVQLTVTQRGEFAADERLLGMAVAAVLVWRKAPFLAVVLGASATTALLRLL